jgi:hypothetical protein
VNRLVLAMMEIQAVLFAEYARAHARVDAPALASHGSCMGRDGIVGGATEDPLAVAAMVEVLLRQHGRVLQSTVLVHLAIIACAGPALATRAQAADVAQGLGRFEPLATLAVAVLVRLVEFGRRVGAEVRRRTRPAAHTKGTSHPSPRATTRTYSDPAVSALERVLPALRLVCRWAHMMGTAWWATAPTPSVRGP